MTTTDSPLHLALQSYGRTARCLSVEAMQNWPQVLIALAGPEIVADSAARAGLAEWVVRQLYTEISAISDPINRRIAEAIMASAKEFNGLYVTERAKYVRDNDQGFSDELFKRRRRRILAELASRLAKAYWIKDAPPIFLAGRYTDSAGEAVAAELGKALATLPITLLAGGSYVGVATCYAMSKSLQDSRTYASERTKLFVRTTSTRLGPVYEPFGDIRHLDSTPTHARYTMLRDARLALLFGGGNGTAEEAAIAAELDIPVIALATTGGTAREYWFRNAAGAQATLPPAQFNNYRDLNHPDHTIAIQSSIRLIAYHLNIRADVVEPTLRP
ncbi:hypothetical protein ACFYO1_13545 [Nocardia sp. NPDC006044]|uniref:hypothetical protein n=1 Tax=Nocardia sp. NPDC006044 TaxID=3364306 RepID=UPI0036AAE019